MSAIVEQVFDAMKHRFNPEAATGLNAVFQFDLSGEQAGQWYVAVDGKECEIVEGMHDSPNVTFSMATPDFVEMMTGKISGQAVFFSGKLRVSGDLMLAQRLEGLFKRAV